MARDRLTAAPNDSRYSNSWSDNGIGLARDTRTRTWADCSRPCAHSRTTIPSRHETARRIRHLRRSARRCRARSRARRRTSDTRESSPRRYADTGRKLPAAALDEPRSRPRRGSGRWAAASRSDPTTTASTPRLRHRRARRRAARSGDRIDREVALNRYERHRARGPRSGGIEHRRVHPELVHSIRRQDVAELARVVNVGRPTLNCPDSANTVPSIDVPPCTTGGPASTLESTVTSNQLRAVGPCERVVDRDHRLRGRDQIGWWAIGAACAALGLGLALCRFRRRVRERRPSDDCARDRDRRDDGRFHRQSQ